PPPLPLLPRSHLREPLSRYGTKLAIGAITLVALIVTYQVGRRSRLRDVTESPSSVAPVATASTSSKPQVDDANTIKAKKAFNQGGDAYNKNDVDLAISYYTEAVRLKPDYADAYNDLGFA